MGSLIATLHQRLHGLRTRVRINRDIRRLEQALAADHPLKVVVGSAGPTPSGWLQTDIEYLNLLLPRLPRTGAPGGSGPGTDDHKVLYNHRNLGTLLTAAGFEVEWLEYFDEEGKFHHRDWHPDDGMIHRSRRFDERNQNGRLAYTSLMWTRASPARETPPAQVRRR